MISSLITLSDYFSIFFEQYISKLSNYLFYVCSSVHIFHIRIDQCSAVYTPYISTATTVYSDEKTTVRFLEHEEETYIIKEVREGRGLSPICLLYTSRCV